MSPSSPFSGVKANLGVVFRGDMSALAALADDLESLIIKHGVKIAFKTVSGSRLWIWEGEP